MGFIFEFFKLLGTVFATFLVLHYYIVLGIALKNYLGLPEALLEQAGFLLLWGSVLVVFKVIRDGWLIWLKEDEIKPVSRVFGGTLAILRGALAIGLLLIYFQLTGNTLLIKTSEKSYSQHYLGDFSTQIYGGIFNRVIRPFFPDEEKNLKVFKLRVPRIKDQETRLE